MLSELIKQLGHRWYNIDNLCLALTHRSLGKPNNERLEYLGDSVLDILVADALFNYHPNRDEGWLSTVRASLVRTERLADIARNINLPKYIRSSFGKNANLSNNRNMIADAVEAVIGAVYVDGGLQSAKKVTWNINIIPSNLERMTGPL